MSNDKQSSVEWLYEKMYEHRGLITIEEFEEAKAMHKEEIKASYADGYKEGYKRALDYITDTIKNKIEIKRDGSNIFTTTTSTTAFLCTTFLSDGSMGATLPRCMKCGKTEYTHPIITNTI